MHSHYQNWKYFRTLLIWHTNKEISLTFDGALNCRDQGVKERVPLKGTRNSDFLSFHTWTLEGPHAIHRGLALAKP